MITKKCGGPCGGQVVWVQVGNALFGPGKSVAIDPEPAEGGTVVIDEVVMEGTSMERYVARLVEPTAAHPDRLRYSRHRC